MNKESIFLFCEKGGWKMNILKNQLCDRHKQYERRKKKKEKGSFSLRDIEELMGLRRPRYERRRGALRQK